MRGRLMLASLAFTGVGDRVTIIEKGGNILLSQSTKKLPSVHHKSIHSGDLQLPENAGVVPFQPESSQNRPAPKKRGRPPKNGWTQTQLLDGQDINSAWEKVANALLSHEPPGSIKEVAKKADISPDMVYRYLKDEGFNRYLDALMDEEIRLCEASIWNTLREMCMNGDLSAIKFYFELRGKRAKNPEEPHETVVQIIDDVPDLSPEELKKIYGPLAGEELEEMETVCIG